jgi:hypothetical protein
VFYSALDVLSNDVEANENVVKALSLHGWSTWILRHDTFTGLSIQVEASSGTGERPADPLMRPRHAFTVTWRASNNWSPFSASTLSNLVSSLCVFRTHKIY